MIVPAPMRLSKPVYTSCLLSLLMAGAARAATAPATPRSVTTVVQQDVHEPCSFRIPSADASEALLAFSRQSSSAVVYVLEQVRGVRTQSVQGVLRPREALERMLNKTSLKVTEDTKTGALMISRISDSEHTNPTKDPRASRETSTAMKKISPTTLIGSLIALIINPAAQAADVRLESGANSQQQTQSATGVIRGTVINKRTGSYLSGAQIRIDGLLAETTSQRDGRFNLLSVSPGKHEIEVSYNGLTAGKQMIQVAAGSVESASFALENEVYRMDAVTVSGVREGISMATQAQRQQVGIKAVLSTDTFPAQNSGNLGEFLKNAPGLYIDYSGQDARSVRLRGVPAAMNLVTQDGLNLASSNSGGNGRTFDLDQTMIQNFEMVEVSKAPTSDMEGQAVGGQINLITKNPLTKKERVVQFDLMFNTTTYGLPGDGLSLKTNGGVNNDGSSVKLKPGGTFYYSDKFSMFGGKDNVGVVMTFNDFDAISFGYQRTNKDLTNGTQSLGADNPGYAHIGSYYYQYQPSRTHRKGASINFYYKLNESTTLHLNNSFSNSQLYNRTNWYKLNANTRDAATSSVINTFAPQANNNTAVVNGDFNNKYGYTTMFDLGGKTILGPTTIDYDVYTTKSTNHYYDIASPPGTAGTDTGQFSGIQITIPNIGFSLTGSPDSAAPSIKQTAGKDMYDLSNGTAMVLNSVARAGKDEWIGYKFDIKRQFNSGAFPFWIKTGMISHDEWRRNDNPRHQWNYTGPTNPSPFGQFVASADSQGGENAKWGMPKFPWISPFAVTKFYLANPQYFTENVTAFVNNEANRNYEHERITGAYIMGSATFAKKFTITTGFRNEWTQDDGEGKLTDRKAYADAIAAGASVLDATKIQYKRRFTNSNSYSTPLGNLQLKYQITPSLVLKGSWHMGIGRPDLPQLLPQFDLNETVTPGTISVNNIGLKPQFAYNGDVLLEYYAKNSLTLTADVFQKKIRNYIANYTITVPGGTDNGYEGKYAGYRQTTAYNMGEGRFKGVELSAAQPFTGLMQIARDYKWLGNFGWFANWTYMWTEQIGTFPNGGGESVYPGKTQSTRRFQNWVPQTFNAGVSYNWSNGAMVFVKYNQRSKAYQYSQANLDVIQKSWNTVDLAIRYPVSKTYSLLFNVNNVFDDRTTFYVQNHLNIRSDIFATQLNFGIRGNF